VLRDNLRTVSWGITIDGSSRTCHLQIGVCIDHDGEVTESRTADDIGIAGLREHVRLTTLDERAMAGIDVTGFREIQRCWKAPAADQVAMTALVNSFAQISSIV
jgi:hypothetical protein